VIEQRPTSTATAARTLCEMRLICDNDPTFHNSSKCERDVAGALRRSAYCCTSAGQRMRIVVGYWLERYGTVPEGGQGIDPWYDSLYDPGDPRQVEQRKRGDLTGIEMRVLKACDVAPPGELTMLYGAGTGRVSSNEPETSNIQKAPIMSNPSPINIETRVFIDDVQASVLTVDQLHQKVREQEAVIKDLEKIENKSKKLGAEITRRHESIKALNEYIDSLPD